MKFKGVWSPRALPPWLCACPNWSAMPTNSCNIEDNAHCTHDTHYHKFVNIHVGGLSRRMSMYCNHRGCNSRLVTHANHACDFIATVDVHRNLCITLMLVVVMMETWERIRNHGRLATTTKWMLASVKMVTHRKNCNMSGPWIMNYMPPLLVGNQEGMPPHYTHWRRWQPPWTSRIMHAWVRR